MGESDPQKVVRFRDLAWPERQSWRERRRSDRRDRHSTSMANAIRNDLVPPRKSSRFAPLFSKIALNPKDDRDIHVQWVDEIRDECQRLQTELQNSEVRNAELAGQKEELKMELIVSSMDERQLLDDTGVKKRWSELEYIIFNIVDERYATPPEADREEPLDALCDIVVEPKEWLQTELHRSWLFQAFIWQKLAETVFGEDGFSACGYNLSGHHGQVWSSYLKALRDECADPDGITRLQYQKLKASMNTILSPKKDVDKTRIAALATDIEAMLEPFRSDPDVPWSYSFESLVRAAAELDADMAKCRSWYQVTMGAGHTMDGTHIRLKSRKSRIFDLDFDVATMEDAVDMKRESGTVSLIVSPLLIKWGDLDGKSFEKSKVLAKRRVVCEHSAWKTAS